MLQLSIQDYEGKSTVIQLMDGELTIGRDEANAIRLTERNVSRHHARISVQGNNVWLESVRATWGTRLNTALIQARSEFRAGDVAQIGDYTLELIGEGAKKRDTALVDEGAAAASAPPPSGPPRGGDNATSIVNLADIQLAIGSPADVATIPVAEQPRLVVESDNLRGMELRVTRTPTTIGRVAESSDLVIDHRSISKEHARITRKPDGSWEVLDLGSANGIQVNGEPYSKVALRSGDVLILGHVALRFLAPGERAAAVSAGGASAGTNKGIIIAVAVVVLLLAGGLVALLALGGDKADQAAPSARDTAAKPQADPREDSQTDEAVAVEAGPSADEMLHKIEKMRSAGMIREALEVARDALQRHEGSASLGLEVKRLEVESEALAKIEQADSVLASEPKQAYDAIGDLRDSLKEDSPLMARGDAVRDKARGLIVAALVVDADRALKRHRLESAQSLAEQIQAYEPDNAEAERILASAKEGDKAAARAKPAPTPERAQPRAEAADKRAPKVEPKPEPKAEPKPKAEPVAKAEPKAAPSEMSGQEQYSAGRRAAASGDNTAAIGYFLAAVKGGYKKAHGQLARLYFQTGDKTNCAKHGNAYIQRYPDAADAPQIEGMLEKCR